MIRRASSEVSVSIAADAGLICSVRSFSSILDYHRQDRLPLYRFLQRPHAFKIHKVGVDFHLRKRVGQVLASGPKLVAMMNALRLDIVIERRQAAVCAAI